MNRLFRRILTILILATSTQWAMAQSESYFLHTVTKGQGLYSISRMYGVTEADIIRLNPGSETVIKVGEQLRIPQTKQEGTHTDTHQEQSSGERFHTIKVGETLYRLTVIYGLTAREICNANPGLSAENFKVGQVVVIPAKKEPQQPTQPIATEPNPIATQNASTTEEPADLEEISNCRTEHLVKRRENIYRISRTYGITELELVEANPELRKRKLKVGEILCIPYTKAEQEKRQAALEEQQQNKKKEETAPIVVPTDEDLFAELRTIPEDIEQIKAAIILPLMLDDSISSDQMKMVEFYEGVLLALDSLKKQGVSIDLHVYDSGDKNTSIRPILAKPEMREMNLIIGPVHDSHIDEASAFADTTGIRLIVPFARQVDAVFTNPYIYQVNTPQSYFYSEVYERFFTKFPCPKVIFFDDPEEEDDDLIDGLKRELTYRDIPHTVLMADTATNKDTILAHLDTERHNILMMTSEKSGSLNNMMPIFQLVVRDTASAKYDISLFGYPQYQVYTNNHLASFYEIDTYFYTSFYTNNLLPAPKAFHQKYRRTYSKEIANRYPKYAILGFDIAYYFLKAMHLYGTDMDNRIHEMDYTPLQTGFKFERVNHWGGFINRKVFFVHFSRDYQLQTIDFDR